MPHPRLYNNKIPRPEQGETKNWRAFSVQKNKKNGNGFVDFVSDLKDAFAFNWDSLIIVSS